MACHVMIHKICAWFIWPPFNLYGTWCILKLTQITWYALLYHSLCCYLVRVIYEFGIHLLVMLSLPTMFSLCKIGNCVICLPYFMWKYTTAEAHKHHPTGPGVELVLHWQWRPMACNWGKEAHAWLYFLQAGISPTHSPFLTQANRYMADIGDIYDRLNLTLHGPFHCQNLARELLPF